MTATINSAFNYNIYDSAKFDAFEQSVQVIVQPEMVGNGTSVFAHCCTSHWAIESFQYAIANANSDEATFRTPPSDNEVVPTMMVLAQIGAVIRRAIRGRLTNLRACFDEHVKVGDDLQIEVRRYYVIPRSDSECSPRISLYFVAKVGGKKIVEGDAIVNANDLSEQPVNPFFAAGLFSALVNTKLPGQGARFRSLNLVFDGDLQPGMPVLTSGTMTGVESHTGRQLIDLFCVSTVGTIAHASASIAVEKK